MEMNVPSGAGTTQRQHFNIACFRIICTCNSENPINNYGVTVTGALHFGAPISSVVSVLQFNGSADMSVVLIFFFMLQKNINTSKLLRYPFPCKFKFILL